jgi:hypothetical protein
MGEPDAPAQDGDRKETPTYEAPRIVWREAYEPLSFGASCAKQPGNPGCNPGPFSS